MSYETRRVEALGPFTVRFDTLGMAAGVVLTTLGEGSVVLQIGVKCVEEFVYDNGSGPTRLAVFSGFDVIWMVDLSYIVSPVENAVLVPSPAFVDPPIFVVKDCDLKAQFSGPGGFPTAGVAELFVEVVLP